MLDFGFGNRLTYPVVILHRALVRRTGLTFWACYVCSRGLPAAIVVHSCYCASGSSLEASLPPDTMDSGFMGCSADGIDDQLDLVNMLRYPQEQGRLEYSALERVHLLHPTACMFR